MSEEISQAFGQLLARSHAMSGERPADRIALRDWPVEVEIGAFQQERGHRQRLRFNIVVEVARDPGPLDDDVDRILSYDTLTEAIATELAAERLNLLETLAERIAARILTHAMAERVFVRIEKLDRGPGSLGVEIVRGRGDALPDAAGDDDAPHPMIVFLSRDAVSSDLLPGWLDQLQKAPRPVILCCGPLPGPRPQAGSPLVQRRIDLLAIEQAAWVLAGRDRRCVVVGTRTELDWAMKHGEITLWAPSKIVLDAVGDRPDRVGEGRALALWFAGLMGADELLVVGAPGDMPERAVGSGRPEPRLAFADAGNPVLPL